jgi:hypothetical protein
MNISLFVLSLQRISMPEESMQLSAFKRTIQRVCSAKLNIRKSQLKLLQVLWKAHEDFSCYLQIIPRPV